MRIIQLIRALLGVFGLPLSRLKPTVEDAVWYVDAIRGLDEEQGAFLAATGIRRSVRIAMNISVLSVEVPEAHEKSDVFLFDNPGAKGIMNPGAGAVDPSMIPGLLVSACVFNDKGRLTKEWVFSTDEYHVAQIWVNDESTIEMILVHVDELELYKRGVKAGFGPDVEDGGLFTLADGRDTAKELHEAAVVFGMMETILRWVETATNMAAGLVMAVSKVISTPYQIVSEQLIDAVVQFILPGLGKVMKRLATMDRTAQVNNVIHVANDADKMMFYMFEAGEIPEFFEGYSSKKLRGMQEKFFDGAIFVSQSCFAHLCDLLVERYEERGLDVEHGLTIFRKPMTHQIRCSGGGLVDQMGRPIGLKGHLKAHIMIAEGETNKRMEAFGYDFLGTTDSFKMDLAITVEDVIAIVVQPKAPKKSLHVSAQHYSAAGLVYQDREDFLNPVTRHFIAYLNDVLETARDETKAQEAAASVAEELPEDSDDDLLGEVRKGANELLSMFATLKMRITDSPAATYVLATNLIQKIGFATLDKQKNSDMSKKGFGRRIDMPAAGVYTQVFPEAFMYAAGHHVPRVAPGTAYLFSYKGSFVAVVSDQEWERHLAQTGDGDEDDFWEFYFFLFEGKMYALTMRHPAVHGEYMIYEMVSTKALLEIWTPMEEAGYIPTIDPALLATQLDLVVMPDGTPLVTKTIEEVYTEIHGGNSTDFDRAVALDVIKTYAQQLCVAGTVVLGEMATRGETSMMDTSFFMGRPRRDLSQISVDTFISHRQIRGPIKNSMRTVLKGVETADWVKSQFTAGPLVPDGFKDFYTYSMTIMYGVMRLNMEHGIVGPVTEVRDRMERIVEWYLREIVNLTYDDFGIKTKRQEDGTYAYDTTSESQVKLGELIVPRLDVLMDDTQGWKQFTNNGKFYKHNTRKAILPSNLDQTEFGHLVRNSSISRFVPAASWVKYSYSRRYSYWEGVWEAQGETDVEKPIDILGRRAWLDAFGQVEADITCMEDLYEFTLALYYVLRATPNISIHNLTEKIQELYGQPGNALTERLLFTSPLARWTEDGENVVLSAFEYAQRFKSELLSSDATDFIPVVLRDPEQVVVYVPRDPDGGSVEVRPVNG